MISIDVGKAFSKCQHPFMTKPLSRQRREEYFLNPLKNITLGKKWSPQRCSPWNLYVTIHGQRDNEDVIEFQDLGSLG